MSSNRRPFIDYDPNNGRFYIHSAPWDVGRCRAIPNRRWLKSKKVWTAPALRLNAQYLKETFTDAEWTTAASNALKRALSQATKSAKDVPFPNWYPFNTKPYEHQETGIKQGYSLDNFALFAEMGTGKSKIVIDVMTARFLERKIRAVVVVCPFSVRQVWVREVAMHSPNDDGHRPATFVLGGLGKRSNVRAFEEFLIKENDGLRWLIVGVESLQQGQAFEYVQRFATTHMCAVVVDESSRIKNHKAIRTDRCIELGKLAKYRVIMSGTPLTQGFIDLYSQFQFLDERIIGVGDYYSFRNRYCVMGGYDDKQIIGYQNIPELMSFIQPHVFQVLKKDVLRELLPKVYQRRVVQLGAEQKRYLKELKARNCWVGDIEVQVQNALELALRQQQVLGGFFSYYEEDPVTKKPRKQEIDIKGKNPKIDELLELAEELVQSKTIVWCRFRREIAKVADALRKKFGKDAVVEFHGGIDDDERWRAIDAFEKGDAHWFVGNQATGGLGITLIATSTVVYFSNTHSYEERAQSEDRAHRSGQTKSVTYIDLVYEGSVDEDILEALETKQGLADFVRERIREGKQRKLHL